MSKRNGTASKCLFGLRVEITEPNQVGDRRAIESHALRDLFMRQLKLGRKSAKRTAALDRVEILSLKVLNKRPLCGGLIINDSNQSRDRLEPGHPSRAEAALPRDQFVNSITVGRPRDDWLHDPCCPNRLS